MTLDNEESAMAAEEVEAARVAAIVEQWGESFRTVATNPRFSFEGDEIVITLWKPIRHQNEDAAVMRMREPTLDDLQKLDAVRGATAQARRLIVSACGITEREAGQIGMRDMTLISMLTSAFTAAAPVTGSML